MQLDIDGHRFLLDAGNNAVRYVQSFEYNGSKTTKFWSINTPKGFNGGDPEKDIEILDGFTAKEDTFRFLLYIINLYLANPENPFLDCVPAEFANYASENDYFVAIGSLDRQTNGFELISKSKTGNTDYQRMGIEQGPFSDGTYPIRFSVEIDGGAYSFVYYSLEPNGTVITAEFFTDVPKLNTENGKYSWSFIEKDITRILEIFEHYE
ncbi:hypothetical protein FACS1894191_5860 [Clostridia bacterium]|nr:hypothetical protein FACS1894191_5860 [Clostridia bacterium]